MHAITRCRCTLFYFTTCESKQTDRVAFDFFCVEHFEGLTEVKYYDTRGHSEEYTIRCHLKICICIQLEAMLRQVGNGNE